MRRVAITLIRFYQLAISPLFPGCCRFRPTCSEYAIMAYKKHGAWRGTLLSFLRLIRCHPLCKGGYDPVPDKFLACSGPFLFSNHFKSRR